MTEAIGVFFSILHVIAAVIIILVVLLQPGKSGGLGLSFGGSSQTIFGASGGVSFLAKVTIASVVIFMTTSIVLSYLSHPRSGVESVIQEVQQQEEAAAAPEEGAGIDTAAQPAAEPKTEQQPLDAPAADAPAAAPAAPADAAPAEKAAQPAAPAEPAGN
jgi:preprotein translocase subunit SecG